MKRKNNSSETNQPAVDRAKQIKSTIRQLKRQVKKISTSGLVAPPRCHIIRYQVRQNQKIYWYYKLQAAEPIFPTVKDPHKKSKYLYLGKAGSSAHIKAVEQVARRGLIDELEPVINTLNESYLDVCFDGETEEYPSYYPEGIKKDFF